jgi:outer membrane receptor protein involved in Fe transport
MLALLTLAAATHAYALEGEETKIAAELRLSRERSDGIALIPVELVLDALRQSKGYSFIFDSRLLFGKNISVVEPSKTSEAELSKILEGVQLRLHKVSANAFAITGEERALEVAGAHSIPETPEAPPPVDTILVVGSTASLPTTTGAKRLFVIDADELAYLGAASPAEAIYDLPQSLASFTPSNTALFGSAAGMSLADLRGLNPRRTMVLMNGRRRTLTSGGNGDIGGVDLAVFAEPFLERIEVQNTPAGARFGGGAVAGTINFVTRSNFGGLEAGGRFGVSERGDSEAASLHAIAGHTFENVGNLTVGLAAARSEGLIGADREFSDSIYGFALDGRRSTSPDAVFLPGFGQSTLTESGLVTGVILADGSFSRFPGGASYIPQPDGGVSQFVGALDQLSDLENTQSTVLPNDRLFGMASFQAEPAGGLRFFIEAHGGVSAHHVSLLPLPAVRARGLSPVTGDAAAISLDNLFLPQSVRDVVQSSFGASATAIVFEHRYAELGPRLSDIDRRSFDIATGLEVGDDDRTFSLSYRYGRNRAVSRESARIDAARLRTALDTTQCAATPDCAPVDFFTTPEISSDALDFISTPELKRTLTISEHEVAAVGTADLDFGGGKEGRVAAGAEFRRSSFSDRDLTSASVEPIAHFRGANTEAGIETFDAFAQVDADLLRMGGIPGALDGSMAVRFTESSQHAGLINFEAGLDWRPAPGLSLFARRHFGERAPDIIELRSLGPSFEQAFFDPCGLDPALQSEIVRANCKSAGPLGVGEAFIQANTLATVTIYGNPELKPERVRSSVYGLSLSPGDWIASFPGRIELTAAWYEFRISNAVSAAENPVIGCFASLNFSSPDCGLNPRTGQPSIVRDPVTRQIESFDLVLRNNGSFNWRGLDLEFRYAGEPAFIPFADLFWVSALHTYTDRVLSDPGTGEMSRLEGLIDFPRHRTLLSAGVEIDQWTIVASANRRGKALTVRSDRPEARIPSAFYLDLTARLRLSDQTYVQAGVQNLTDAEPAITAFNDSGNFAAEFYDPIGRRYFASFRVNF